jgi:hypothetical protein
VLVIVAVSQAEQIALLLVNCFGFTIVVTLIPREPRTIGYNAVGSLNFDDSNFGINGNIFAPVTGNALLIIVEGVSERPLAFASSLPAEVLVLTGIGPRGFAMMGGSVKVVKAVAEVEDGHVEVVSRAFGVHVCPISVILGTVLDL